MTKFTVTEQHLTLLRNTYVGWGGCEYGAPAIDCKRPYGNGGVEADIAELLGLELYPNGNEDGYDDPDEAVSELCGQLHRDTETVLQIVLATGKFEAGEYQLGSGYGKDWVLVDDVQGHTP